MEPPTKQETAEIFKVLQSKRENKASGIILHLNKVLILGRLALIAMQRIPLGHQSLLASTSALTVRLYTEILGFTLVLFGIYSLLACWDIQRLILGLQTWIHGRGTS